MNGYFFLSLSFSLSLAISSYVYYIMKNNVTKNSVCNAIKRVLKLYALCFC